MRQPKVRRGEKEKEKKGRRRGRYIWIDGCSLVGTTPSYAVFWLVRPLCRESYELIPGLCIIFILCSIRPRRIAHLWSREFVDCLTTAIAGHGGL